MNPLIISVIFSSTFFNFISLIAMDEVAERVKPKRGSFIGTEGPNEEFDQPFAQDCNPLSSAQEPHPLDWLVPLTQQRPYEAQAKLKKCLTGRTEDTIADLKAHLDDRKIRYHDDLEIVDFFSANKRDFIYLLSDMKSYYLLKIVRGYLSERFGKKQYQRMLQATFPYLVHRSGIIIHEKPKSPYQCVRLMPRVHTSFATKENDEQFIVLLKRIDSRQESILFDFNGTMLLKMEKGQREVDGVTVTISQFTFPTPDGNNSSDQERLFNLINRRRKPFI